MDAKPEVKLDARKVAHAGIAAALLAVSAWVTIPLGPVPFTLQTMVLALLPAALDRASALLAVFVYLLIGAIGLPVFAGFGAGMGTLAGPTGGFLWGFLLGMAAATTLVRLLPRSLPLMARTLAGDALLELITYTCGTLQLMLVMGVGASQALVIAVLPFLLPDVVKVVLGARLGCLVARATRHDESLGVGRS